MTGAAVASVAVSDTVVAAPAARAAWLGPVATAAAGAAALAYVAASDPVDRRTLVPPCPFHAATGLWCPGCGLTRATGALLHGHVLTGLGYNLFTPVLFLLIGWSWAAWLGRATGRPIREPASIPKPVWVTLLAAVAVFTVARNLPLAPLRGLAP